jgi:hypothetical protein
MFPLIVKTFFIAITGFTLFESFESKLCVPLNEKIKCNHIIDMSYYSGSNRIQEFKESNVSYFQEIFDSYLTIDGHSVQNRLQECNQ